MKTPVNSDPYHRDPEPLGDTTNVEKEKVDRFACCAAALREADNMSLIMKRDVHSRPVKVPVASEGYFSQGSVQDSGSLVPDHERPTTSSLITPVNSPEDVWGEIRNTAGAVIAKEPLLALHVQQLILNQTSLSGAVAAVLAHKLQSTDVTATVLRTLCNAEFDNEKSISLAIAADLSAVRERDPACASTLHVLLNLKGFQALQAHRLSHLLWKQGRTELAFFLANRSSLVFSIDIHPAARIGRGVMLDHGTGIVIGETAVVEDNVSLLQEVTLGGTGKENGDRHPKVRSGVMIGAGAKILGNIEIGMMSKVAAGSVVLRDVPAFCTVAGVPAKVVRQSSSTRCPSLEMDQSV